MAGLCISRDAGDSWDSITEGLPTTSGWGLPLRALELRAGTTSCSLTASNGPQSDEAGVYRGRLDSSVVAPALPTTGLPATFRDNIDTGCLSAGGGVAAFGTTDGSVYVTTRHGESWDTLAHDLPPVLCVQVH